MIISLVVAASENNAIGRDNKLLWHLPNDLKFFKNITWAMPVVMGRKTFESINKKPLKGRMNIILTRQKHFTAEGFIVVNDLDDTAFIAQKHDYKELMVLGGGEIYKQSIHLADKIELTRVHTTCDADAFFPEINLAEWKVVKEEYHPKNEKHLLDFTYLTFEKR